MEKDSSIDNLLLKKALEIAQKTHQNQLDKAGKPYFEHPLRVMNKLELIQDKIVAVLHDVVEDSDLTLEDLIVLGFTPDIIDAIDAITKRPDENYETYLNRVMSNQIALRVKIADMHDNLDISRISHPTEKDIKRIEKYTQIYPRLVIALHASELELQKREK
jgi:guanosine-3',5'-bis(diphosphate) 3'-pyrophosphohydrolase